MWLWSSKIAELVICTKGGLQEGYLTTSTSWRGGGKSPTLYTKMGHCQACGQKGCCLPCASSSNGRLRYSACRGRWTQHRREHRNLWEELVATGNPQDGYEAQERQHCCRTSKVKAGPQGMQAGQRVIKALRCCRTDDGVRPAVVCEGHRCWKGSRSCSRFDALVRCSQKEFQPV